MKIVNTLKLDRSTVNREAGTFKVRSTTTYPNLRNYVNAKGATVPVYEILSHDPKDIDLSRVPNGGVSFMLNHDSSTKMGSVIEIEVDPGVATYSTVKILDKYKERVFDLIDAEAMTHVSVGGKARHYVAKDVKDSIEVYTRAWDFQDLSFTPTPADSSCHIVRSSDNTDTIIHSGSEFTAEEDKVILDALDAVSTEQVEYKHVVEVDIVNNAGIVANIAAETDPEVLIEQPVYERFVPTLKAKRVTHLDAPDFNVPLNTEKKVNHMSMFKMISELKKGTLPESSKGQITVNETGGFIVSNDVISRSFAAGTGVNTTGFTDQGGNLIPRDMSSEVIGNIYRRLTLRQAGVRFVQLSRPTMFPVIVEEGAASWIDENGNAVVANVRTTNKNVKPHYIRLVYDISNSAIQEAASNISVEAIFSEDWVNKFGLLLEQAFFKGDPAVTAGSPRGIVTELLATPALAGNVLTYAGTAPAIADIYAVLTVAEQSQSYGLTFFATSAMKYKLVAAPIVAGHPTFLARDTGNGQAEIMGRPLYVVDSSVLANDELVAGSITSCFIASFHGSMEVIEDEKILAGNNQTRFTIRAAYDVMFMYPKHFVYLTKAP